jgi:hypothetical protein
MVARSGDKWKQERVGEWGHYTFYHVIGCINPSTRVGRKGDSTVKKSITDTCVPSMDDAAQQQEVILILTSRNFTFH